MNRLSSYLFAIVFAVATTAILAAGALHRSQVVVRDMNHQADAAFRDGLFLGRFDAEHGRRPHLMSARWGTATDRRSFISAYLQAYGEKQTGAAALLAAQPGYRDGISDGRQQRYASKPFQPNATENYRKAAHGYPPGRGDLSQYQRAYREAYCNGYQQAYYGETETTEMTAQKIWASSEMRASRP